MQEWKERAGGTAARGTAPARPHHAADGVRPPAGDRTTGAGATRAPARPPLRPGPDAR
ncbi:hypothetical protein [Streptomyces sp. NPDC001744]|uniref:hypothetical protein n=1 Tax=Streptomyces sp. NPDC001744 TaxID=3364606 RepID=UPI00367B3D60